METKQNRSKLSICTRLIGLTKPLAGFMALAIFMGTIGHLCAAFLTVAGVYAVWEVVSGQVTIAVPLLLAAMPVLALARGLLHYAEQACNHFIAFKLLAHIRHQVFAALRRLCPAKLESRDKGDLIAVITADIELLEVFYAHTISPIALAVLFCVLLCGFIGAQQPLLGLLAAAAYLVVGVGVPLAAGKAGGDDGRQFRAQSGGLSSFVLDSLRGLPEILQYGSGAARLDEMNEKTDALSAQERKQKNLAALGTAATNSLILLLDLAMLLAASALYGQGALSMGGVLLSVAALMSSFGPVVALANLGTTLQNTFAAGGRVLDILDETPAVQDVTGQPETAFTGAAAQHITFAYAGEEVLSDVSVEIPQNKIIGIAGRSGSGKSTLLKLFMRFWAVQQGQISISGRAVDTVNTADLRGMESFVTQDTHLFHDSILNNLRIAKQDATREQVEDACKKASIHEVILRLPQGYDTPVGELGDTLSGGEKQRIGLARAFLHDAPFVLLDEPTSNLDSLNEAVILRSLNSARAGKTVVLVSHRQSTMRIADTVYSVEDGRVS